MGQDHAAFRHALGAGGAHVILGQIVQHGRAHKAADLAGDLQGQNHDGHERLPDLVFKRIPTVDDVHGVINGREPVQLDRKDHDHQNAGKERRDRKPNHGDKCPGLVKHRILFVGRDDSNRDRDQNTHHIGRAHHPQCLRQTLNNNVHHRGSELPRQNAQLAFGKGGAKQSIEHVQRLNPEKLHQPLPIPNINRFPQSQRRAHFFTHFGRDCQGLLGQRIVGRQIQKKEDHQRDDQKRRYGQNQSSDCEGQHRRLG